MGKKLSEIRQRLEDAGYQVPSGLFVKVDPDDLEYLKLVEANCDGWEEVNKPGSVCPLNEDNSEIGITFDKYEYCLQCEIREQCKKLFPPDKCIYEYVEGINFGQSFNQFEYCQDCVNRTGCKKLHDAEYKEMEPACGKFVMTPFEFFYQNIRRDGLSPNDICIIGALMANATWRKCKTFVSEGKTYVSNGTIKELTGVSDSAIQRSMLKLKKLGYITDTGMHHSGSRFRTITLDPGRPNDGYDNDNDLDEYPYD